MSECDDIPISGARLLRSYRIRRGSGRGEYMMASISIRDSRVARSIDAIKILLREMTYAYVIELLVYSYIQMTGSADNVAPYRDFVRDTIRRYNAEDVLNLHNTFEDDLRISRLCIREDRDAHGRRMIVWEVMM